MQFKVIVFIILLISITRSESFGQCIGLDADAGPDLFTCDPTMMVQLMGSILGTYNRLMWTPSAGLSDSKILDPMVTLKTPGIYKFKLTAEGLSTNNLIINGDFESGNTGFSTGYNFSPVNTTEGEYIVTANPSTWNGGFSPCGDHTSGGGNMLLLNGHPNAGTNCWCQTIATVPGRTYEFSFWSQSVVASNIAQLGVKLNGNAIGSTIAGGLCAWELFTVTFVATSASSQLCIAETSGIRGGNDFALDDITLFEKCIDEDEVIVEIVDLKAVLDIPKRPKCSSEVFDLAGIGSSTGPKIRYEWSTDIGKIISQNGFNAKAKGSGTYTLKVIYTNGTIICEKEVSIDYMAPDELFGEMKGVGIANCRLDTINLDANVLTGSGDYTYRWSPDSLILIGQNTDRVKVIQPGIYNVTVTDKTTGCELILDYEVTQDTLHPNASVKGDTLIDCTKNAVALNSLLTDTSRYQFIWTKPDQTQIKDSVKIKSNLSGKYTLTVIDKKNYCQDTRDWYVTVDSLVPQIDLGTDLVIDCKNNGVNIIPTETSQTGMFGYYWNLPSGALGKETNLLDKMSVQSGQVILKVINEQNGCASSDTLLINDVRQLPIIDAGVNDLLTCKINSINLQGSGPTNANTKINWTTNGGNISSNPNSYTPIINKSGWYIMTVTDTSNSCSSIDSVFIDENRIAPVAQLGPDLVFKCSDTLITINANGSSQGNNIQYNWSSINGTIKKGQGTRQIEVSSSGDYKLEVIDTINGCRDTASIKVTPDQNSPIASINKPDTLTCKVIEITLNAMAQSQSGNALSYQWKGSGGVIQNPTTLNPKVDQPGTYILEVFDQVNGCSTQVVTNVILDNEMPMPNAGKDELLNCKVTQISLDASKSTAKHGMNFQWSTTNGSVISNPNQTKINIQSPGLYIMEVTDSYTGCLSTDTVEVKSDVQKPIANILNSDTLNCRNATVQINGLGSSIGNRMQYNWTSTNGNILSDPKQLIIDVDRAGMYIIEVLDSVNGCVSYDTIQVIENKLKPIITIDNPKLLTCKILSTDLSAQLNNVSPNYTIQWHTNNGQIVSGQNTLNPKVNLKGIYYLKIINTENGCESIDSVTVSQNTNYPTQVNADVIQPKCPNESGVLQINGIIGGEPPLSYYVDSKINANTFITGLVAGKHALKIVDANGCELDYDFDIVTTTPISVDLIPSVKINEGESYNIIPVYSIPDDSIQSVNWSPSIHLSCSDCLYPKVNGLNTTTTYVVTYTNKNGCSASDQITISVIKKGIWIPNIFSPNGDQVNDHFYPVLSDDSYKEIKSMSIYNRWGERIFLKEHFQPNNTLEGWDGTSRGLKLNPDVFIYSIEVLWNSGETEKFHGDVTLIK
ncbi:MAG: gliding motility-associated C-terminal domain-containing protein [Saprospiraceae bacterium]|nr:gliding motility-associated C-terminal domain-containing protein [Candidatus Defluviibacterium haderslevense]